MKAKVAVLRRIDGTLAIMHGPRKLVEYEPNGAFHQPEIQAIA